MTEMTDKTRFTDEIWVKGDRLFQSVYSVSQCNMKENTVLLAKDDPECVRYTRANKPTIPGLAEAKEILQLAVNKANDAGHDFDNADFFDAVSSVFCAVLPPTVATPAEIILDALEAYLAEQGGK